MEIIIINMSTLPGKQSLKSLLGHKVPSSYSHALNISWNSLVSDLRLVGVCPDALTDRRSHWNCKFAGSR